MAIGTAAAILGAGALGAAGSAYAASQASNAQANAAQAALDAQERMLERQLELQEPFRAAGITSMNQLLTLLGLPGGDPNSASYGSMAKPFDMTKFEADPGYGFRMQEGMKALENSAAARGGLLSGATLKGVNRFSQGLASQEYQNAFNRYQIERNAQLNPLQSLMGAGQTATNQLAGAMGQTEQGLAQSYGNLGQAQASAYVGMGNALTGALGQGVNSYMGLQYLNAMNPAAAASANPYSYGAGGYTGMGPFIGG